MFIYSGTPFHAPNVMLSDDPIPSQTYLMLLVLSSTPLTNTLPERGDRSACYGRASEALAPCPTHGEQLRAQTWIFFRGVRISHNPPTRVKDIDPLGNAPKVRCPAAAGKVGGGGRWFTGALAFTGQATGVYGGYGIPVDAGHPILTGNYEYLNTQNYR